MSPDKWDIACVLPLLPGDTSDVSYTLRHDPRGESDSYLAYSFVCTAECRLVWHEGLRRDWRGNLSQATWEAHIVALFIAQEV